MSQKLNNNEPVETAGSPAASGKLVSSTGDIRVQQQQHYLTQATASNTRRAYQTAIRQFERQGGILPATEQQVAQYLTDQATRLNPRTLSLHLTALSHWHTYQKFPDPTQTPYIRKLLTGIYRQNGKPKRKAKALYPEHIAKMGVFRILCC